MLRIEGFDRILPTPLPRLSVVTKPAVTPAQRRTVFAKRVLAARGLDEAVTWSFMGSKESALFDGNAALDLINPISADLTTMRPSILPNLIQAAARNAARGYPDVALFEVGPAYRQNREVTQVTLATGIRTGQRAPRPLGSAKPVATVDAFDAKAGRAGAMLAALGLESAKMTASTATRPPGSTRVRPG